MRHLLHAFDRNVTAGMVNLFGPNLRPFFEFITMLGDPITIFLIAGSIGVYSYVQSNMKLFLAACAIPLTLMIGTLLKLLFERAGPLTDYAMGMKL